MNSYNKMVDLQLNKYKLTKDEKFFISCMYNLFISYLLEPDVYIIKKFKNILYNVTKEVSCFEEIKVFEILLNVLEQKDLNYGYFEKNKNFYKSSYNKDGDRYYLLYLFFLSLQSNNPSEKASKVFEKYISKDKFACLLLGIIYFYDNNLTDMYEQLYLSYLRGNNSVFLYIFLGKYFQRNNISDYHNLLPKYLIWAINHKVNVNQIFNIHSPLLKIITKEDLSKYLKIYYSTKNIKVLEIIVKKHIEYDYEVDEKIFELYKEAYIKQLNINSLNDIIIKNANKFNYINISNFSLKQFLSKNTISKDNKPFIYHLLIIRTNLSDILLQYKNDIFEYGKKVLKYNIEDKYLYSIFKFILLNFKDKLNKAEVNKLENIIFENLFKYEITFDRQENYRAKVIWVKNKEFLDGDTFFIDNQDVYVYSLYENCNPIFFDLGKKNILDIKYKITPCIQGDNTEIIKYFYDNNMKSDFLVLAYLNILIQEENYTNIEAFKEALSINLSSHYKNIINNILGIHYFKQDNATNAIKYLEDVKIVNKNLSKVLITTYIDLKDYKSACEILISAFKNISCKDVSFFISKLVDKKLEYNLSEIAYFCLVENEYDTKILSYLVHNFNGDINQYKTIFKSLKNDYLKGILSQKIISLYINKKILSNNNKDLNFFTKALGFLEDDETLNFVSQYLSYEIIVNDLKITKELLTILEDIVINKKITILSVAISKVYVNTKTKNMEKVLQTALCILKDNNIVLPYFKDIPYFSKEEFINKCLSIVYFSNKKEELILITDKNNYTMKYLGVGIYYYSLNCFYGETINYKIVNVYGEVLKEKVIKNEKIFICNSNDIYFKINNALIYKSLHKFDLLEKELFWLNEEKDNDFLII